MIRFFKIIMSQNFCYGNSTSLVFPKPENRGWYKAGFNDSKFHTDWYNRQSGKTKH